MDLDHGLDDEPSHRGANMVLMDDERIPPDEINRLNLVMGEMAAKERLIADVTGEGQPHIQIGLYYGEVVTLLRLLEALRNVPAFEPQAAPLIDAINRQMEGKWDPPPGWMP